MNLTTRLRSTGMRVIGSARLLAIRRGRARLKRKLGNERPRVHYFHQVNDPYSHLAVQKIAALMASYRVSFQFHLVSGPDAAYQGDDARFEAWAYNDAISVAPFFSSALPASGGLPEADQVRIANGIVGSKLNTDEFLNTAISVGEKLFSGEPLVDPQVDAKVILKKGNQLREKLGHYLGAMFYFEGEWYWGVDRLHLLEQRLIDEGFQVDAGSDICVPLPEIKLPAEIDASSVTLEYFPSLRSPYTAVGHQRVVRLLERYNVDFKLRPVMPMMMRGVPAPTSKQFYIMQDAAREARYYKVPFGNFVDPFGEPVKRAFSLFPAAVEQGLGLEYITAYLRATFAEGIDITSIPGLCQVVLKAGMNPHTVEQSDDWETLLEANVKDMLSAGLWGVPSFRVTGGNDASSFSCWGQDRIWRVEAEIGKRLGVLEQIDGN